MHCPIRSFDGPGIHTHLPSRLLKARLSGRVSLVAQPEKEDGLAEGGPMLGVTRPQPVREPRGLHSDGEVQTDLPYDPWQLRETT